MNGMETIVARLIQTNVKRRFRGHRIRSKAGGILKSNSPTSVFDKNGGLPIIGR